MERLKIGEVGKVGSAVLLLTLIIGCGGGGKQENDGGQDVRADVKADVKTDVKVDVPADVPVDLPTGVDVPGPDLHRSPAQRHRDRRRLRRQLPGLPGRDELRRSTPTARAACARAASAPGSPAPTASRTRRRPTSTAAAAARPATRGKACLAYTDCVSYVCSGGRLLGADLHGHGEEPGRDRRRLRRLGLHEVRRRQGVRQQQRLHAAAAATSGRCSSCRDLIKNGDEVDVDCGGALCATCGDGKICRADTRLPERARVVGGVCISCIDKLQNGGETDVDCGGATTCAKCADGKHCAAATDCAGNRCTAGTCTSCTDGKMNGDETDVDCGGTMCTACANGKRCVATTDCASRICTGNVCVAANCTDTVLNGSETDVDCGGTDCKRCAVGQVCQRRHRLRHGVCTAGRCVAASCTDGVKNQGETDVDCGGTTACPRCADFKTCAAPTDCATNACTMGFCGTTGCQSFGMMGGYVGCQRTVPVANLPCEDIRTTGTQATGGQRRQLHDVDAAVLVQLLRCGADVGAGQRVGRAQLQHDQPVHHQLVPDEQHDADGRRLLGALAPVERRRLHPDHRHRAEPALRRAVERRHYGGGATLLDVRAVLKEGKGDIDVCYVNTTSGSVSYDLGITSTSGISSGTGTYLQYNCNTATVGAGLLLTYTAP